MLTNAITDAQGQPLQKSAEYLLAASRDPFDASNPLRPLQVLVNAMEDAAARELIKLLETFNKGKLGVPRCADSGSGDGGEGGAEQ